MFSALHILFRRRKKVIVAEAVLENPVSSNLPKERMSATVAVMTYKGIGPGQEAIPGDEGVRLRGALICRQRFSTDIGDGRRYILLPQVLKVLAFKRQSTICLLEHPGASLPLAYARGTVFLAKTTSIPTI